MMGDREIHSYLSWPQEGDEPRQDMIASSSEELLELHDPAALHRRRIIGGEGGSHMGKGGLWEIHPTRSMESSHGETR